MSTQENWENWLPTPDAINALPEPLRQYIHDLHTNSDPQGIIASNVCLTENCKALEILNGEQLEVIDRHASVLIAITERLRGFLREPMYDLDTIKQKIRKLLDDLAL